MDQQTVSVDLIRFKRLLEYFVSHVEYCQRLYLRNNGQDIDPTTCAGFDEYTASLVRKENDDKLDPHEVNEWKPDTVNALKNKRIKGQWDTFGDREVRMVVKNHFGSYASAKCFLDHGGWRNVNNVWNEDRSRIVALKIRRNIHDSKEKVEWVNAKVSSIEELGLFDGQEPNAALEDFFNVYMNL